MREIKFRVWNPELQEMYILSKKEYLGGIGIYDDLVGHEKGIWMQYTGLKDRNGREIYEGDIVRIWGGEYWQGYWEVDEIGEVVFEVYSFGTKSNGRFYPFNIAFEPYDLEIKVIGNIFEHPHLLDWKDAKE